ncbi:RNA-directed DNA polymerase [Mammaliicoccus sciuri]|uniref:RNA-directed DNA polymerase n=1 Tax=Mammaliicoccus sciuri TaxID=1296 RepID=UPI001F1018EA|nr:RNA-directed DNA polymerase [Mammaliicoccus sciuri]MEB6696394.1 RNA-directed DNA polymerase [Mammaliicoccus sciuri]WQK42522.1 RNA-directed DNA polymerase [Mammaliicoccus sciuri]
MINKIQYLTEMSHREAHQFLLKSESYCNIELPKYFQFDSILKKIDGFFDEVDKKNLVLKSFINMNELKSSDSTNCKIFANKDGKFDWRPLEIINPYLYVYLVRYMTNEDNWEEILKSIKSNSAENIIVASIPVKALTNEHDKEKQILNWWDKVEQKSIELALKYNYVLSLDISNCYGSIYTHSIPWAIHGKDYAKKNQSNNILGNKIDFYIRLMQNNQTNGIPQGSILMDFIAEIVLSYADKMLDKKLKEKNELTSEYTIVRYRDDYRIFSNSKEDINLIAKLLNDVLMSLNFKLNSKKTIYSEDVVLSSIKFDKIAYQKLKTSLYIKDFKGRKAFQLTLQKHLFQILVFSKKYPNSGSVVRMLNEFNKWRAYKVQNKHDNNKRNEYMQCISIVIEIMLNNTKTVPLCISIISQFIVLLETEERKEVILNIKSKIQVLPNTDLINIWLQRLTLHESQNEIYDTEICKLVSGETQHIFDIDWITNKKYKIIDDEIVNQEIIEKINTVISNEEVSIFNY